MECLSIESMSVRSINVQTVPVPGESGQIGEVACQGSAGLEHHGDAGYLPVESNFTPCKGALWYEETWHGHFDFL